MQKSVSKVPVIYISFDRNLQLKKKKRKCNLAQKSPAHQISKRKARTDDNLIILFSSADALERIFSSSDVVQELQKDSVNVLM